MQNLQIKNEEGKIIPEVLRERTKVDMFIAETVGKASYSRRNELTGANGEKLLVMPNELINKNAPHTSTE